MMIRFVSFAILLVAAFLLPWWATLIGVVYYTRWYTGIELIVGMVLIDAYFGVLVSSPLLTLGTLSVVVLGSLFRGWFRTHSYTSL